MAHAQLDWEMAIHEAAHAVVGIVEGLNIELASVAVAPDGVRLGRVWGLRWPAIAEAGAGTVQEIAECSRLARQMLAGPIATLDFYPDAHHGGAEDFAQVDDLARELFAEDEERTRWKQAVDAQARKVVTSYRDAIRQVADDLLNKGNQNTGSLRATVAANPGTP